MYIYINVYVLGGDLKGSCGSTGLQEMMLAMLLDKAEALCHRKLTGNLSMVSSKGNSVYCHSVFRVQLPGFFFDAYSTLTNFNFNHEVVDSLVSHKITLSGPRSSYRL